MSLNRTSPWIERLSLLPVLSLFERTSELGEWHRYLDFAPVDLVAGLSDNKLYKIIK